MPVNAMQRHKVRVIQPTDQPPQQRLLDIFTGRGYRQEMRFVCHHQMLVRIQNRFDHRDRLFVRHFPKIVNPQAFLVRKIKGDWRTVPIEDTTPGDSIQPLLATDGAEVFAQAIEYGLPRARRQVERTGLAVRSRKR